MAEVFITTVIGDAGALHAALARALGEDPAGVVATPAGTVIHLRGEVDGETADRIKGIAEGFRSDIERLERPMAVNLTRRAQSFRRVQGLWR
ncbi:MAG TPA: hypothetical protein PKD46_17095 [Aggregatilineaceae bacterium]|nr:hypothetical protein [Aggregatilineaceae bacterium]